uniref:DUF3591 domain-containing protein n=1 Tax=Gongylonema pulchrum TaxID=637853 RepID=A0A183ERI9_9BILA
LQDGEGDLKQKLKRRVTRAKLVHSKTLALYDKQLNEFRGCMEPHLFDRALIRARTDCPDLFIPDFTHAKAYAESDQWPGDEEFVLTLTDELGKRFVPRLLFFSLL